MFAGSGEERGGEGGGRRARDWCFIGAGEEARQSGCIVGWCGGGFVEGNQEASKFQKDMSGGCVRSREEA